MNNPKILNSRFATSSCSNTFASDDDNNTCSATTPRPRLQSTSDTNVVSSCCNPADSAAVPSDALPALSTSYSVQVPPSCQPSPLTLGGGGGMHTSPGFPSSCGPPAASTATSSATVGSQSLSIFQRKLLVSNWSHLTKSGTGGIGNVIFQKFLSRRPEMRRVFTKAAVVSGFAGESTSLLPDHVKWLVDLMDRTINSLDRLDEVGDMCAEYGRCHAHLNASRGADDSGIRASCDKGAFSTALWDVFGQSMLESMTQLEVVRKHKELVRAWIVLISFLVDKFREGYATGIRRQHFLSQKALSSSAFSPKLLVAASQQLLLPPAAGCSLACGIDLKSRAFTTSSLPLEPAGPGSKCNNPSPPEICPRTPQSPLMSRKRRPKLTECVTKAFPSSLQSFSPERDSSRYKTPFSDFQLFGKSSTGITLDHTKSAEQSEEALLANSSPDEIGELSAVPSSRTMPKSPGHGIVKSFHKLSLPGAPHQFSRKKSLDREVTSFKMMSPKKSVSNYTPSTSGNLSYREY